MRAGPTVAVTGPDGTGDERERAQRRTLRVLVAGQVLGGVGLAAGVAVGALLARDLLDGDSLTGLPVAVGTAGGALAAPLLARLADLRGRRPGLALGYLLGAAGSVIVVVAAAIGSFALLLAGMVLFGAGNTSSLMARFAGADLALPGHRARALGTVLFATTFGAVAGPNLIDATGAAADAVGLPVLSGPFALSALAYGAAAAVVALALRPDPLLLARAIDAAARPAVPAAPSRRGGWAELSHGPALTGVSAMVAAQTVMVGVMTMTPLHMRAHDHGLSVIGLVISVHIAGMYLFSPLVGLLCDRVGRMATVRAGAVTLTAAGVLAAAADPASSVVLAIALFLLGLGWSLCLVAGSALVVDAVPLARRPQAQGNADLLVGLAGATGGLGSGVVLGAAGFAAVGLLAAVISVVFLGPRWVHPPAAPADATG
ncbi:MFS transporter [Miltoncostaea oceani]|uniref:MFS transporter n=1 Tax=Miltoncostaea oceani TaxID=2843216 RepID=UPI001C3CC0B1|nr:MFS transporter [Miltoncostaea oceani]